MTHTAPGASLPPGPLCPVSPEAGIKIQAVSPEAAFLCLKGGEGHLTLQEELELYEEALRAVLLAQEYRIGGRLVQRPPLDVLYRRIDYLRGQIAAETYGTTAYAAWPGR